MRRIGTSRIEPLYGADTTRAIEQAATAALPPHSLMALAGLSVAQLANALAPHARNIWVACGPGNNGGDGLVSATYLHRRAQATGEAQRVVFTLHADEDRMPSDAAYALAQARAAGVQQVSAPPTDFDLAIDALLGIGTLRPPEGRLAEHLTRLQQSPVPVLCVDVPSGLNANTGVHLNGPANQPLPGPRHTLSLLTLKPGLFTTDGRDQAGTVWFDDLGITPPPATLAAAHLHGIAGSGDLSRPRAHATHKGSHGEVVVLGGQDIGVNGIGMTGAAILAARAALYGGAGRVYVGLLTGDSAPRSPAWDPVCPELMFRHIESLLQGDLLTQASVVCGCGGGSAVSSVLPAALARAQVLVLDADALNTIAADSQLQALVRHRGARGWTTVLTPHPLEAARLLGKSTAVVMADRLGAARQLSEEMHAICVLKGSGSVICAPGRTPLINASGNGALATAGTGDVLAGLIGSALASQPLSPDLALHRVAAAVFQHGWLADRWNAHGHRAQDTLTASQLAASVHPVD